MEYTKLFQWNVRGFNTGKVSFHTIFRLLSMEYSALSMEYMALSMELQSSFNGI